jgi:hypothetical protein
MISPRDWKIPTEPRIRENRYEYDVFYPSALLDLRFLMLVSIAAVPLALALRKVKLGGGAPRGH